MLAEAILDIPGIPKINEVESVNQRRHSTGKIFLPNGGATVFSRYLKARQSSCHDLCKYGMRGNLETESESLRIPVRKLVPKLVIPKRSAGHSQENAESNFRERRKKTEVSLKLSPYTKVLKPDVPVVIKIAQRRGGPREENPERKLKDGKTSEVSLKPSGDNKTQKPDECPPVSLNPSPDDMVDTKTISADSAAQDKQNAETKLSEGENEPCLKPCPDSKSQRHSADPDCIGREVSSRSDKEIVSPEHVPSAIKDSDVAVAHAKNAKLKTQSKPSSLLKQSCSNGKESIEGSKSKEINVTSMNALAVSSCRNKDEVTISEGMKTSAIGEKKNEETNTSVLKLNAKNKSGGSHSKKQENAKKIKPAKSFVKDARGSKNLNRVSHLMDQQNKKSKSDQASFADTTKKTLYRIKSNPENNAAETIESSSHVSYMSTNPSSSSKGKSIRITQNRISMGQSPRSHQKKNMIIYRPKGIQVQGLPQFLSSFPGKKGLRSTPYGFKVTQPSSTSLSSSAPSKSPYSHASSQHDEVGAKLMQSSTSKMMSNGRPKRALTTTSKDNNVLQSEKLDFQRGKVIHVPLEDSTPRKLVFKRRAMTDNRNDDNQKGNIEDFSPRRLNLRKRLLVDNKKDGDQSGGAEKFTPRRLEFRQRVLVGNRNADSSNGKGDDDHTPRRLKFKPRVLVGNRIADSPNGKGGNDHTPRRLKFKPRVIVGNRNAGSPNGKGDDDHTPRRLKFKPRVLVGNRNADSPNGKSDDDHTPRRLTFKRRVIDDNKSGKIQNSEGDTSKNNSEGKEAIFFQDNATQNELNQISLRQSDVSEKTDSMILYNNVIEQTASRFVRSNSSKVKALVSAFESVISLLDTNVSATSSTC
ncbi:hypothetical protein COLO4_36879 [Corchorus olitorius]|uniref:Calmodulin-binding domain-containing protein n=1 Tax=Corchorus olitorius TaxID=93759 RepID=A0A1R3G4I6_9ROSI|nr:hypothetical protein COLO4_36879 [Corchorus olitorius]